MAKKFSARRYAQAIFDIAQENNKINEWQVQLDEISHLDLDKTIAAYLENPAVSFKEKQNLFSGKMPDIDPMIVNLLYLLLDDGTIDMLTDVVNEYKKMVDKHNGIARAEIVATVPMDDVTRPEISAHLSEMLGKKVLIEREYIDPGLIGGFVAKVNGKLLDGSTRHKLNILKKQIS